MTHTLTKAIIRNGQVELPAPLPLPDGTEVFVTSRELAQEAEGPMTPEEIARVIAAMEQMKPFEMTPEEEAEIEAARQRNQAYTIANMHQGVEDIFS